MIKAGKSAQIVSSTLLAMLYDDLIWNMIQVHSYVNAETLTTTLNRLQYKHIYQ